LQNTVHWITPYATLDDIPPAYPPDDIFVEAPDEVQEGWLFNEVDGTFSLPPKVYPQPTMPTNQEIAQQLSALQIDFITAKLTETPSKEEWHNRYLSGRVARKDLLRLTPEPFAVSIVEEWDEEYEELYGNKSP